MMVFIFPFLILYYYIACVSLQMDDDRMDTMFKDMWKRNPEQTSSLHTAAQKWDPDQS